MKKIVTFLAAAAFAAALTGAGTAVAAKTTAATKSAATKSAATQTAATQSAATQSAATQSAATQTAATQTSATKTAATAVPSRVSRIQGNWTWWGYRTNSWETWAIATQSPSYVNLHMGWLGRAMGFYVYAQAYVWKVTAQNARMMGQCLGIDWAGSGLIVGCSSS